MFYIKFIKRWKSNLIHQKRLKNSDESNLMNEEQRNNWLGIKFYLD